MRPLGYLIWVDSAELKFLKKFFLILYRLSHVAERCGNIYSIVLNCYKMFLKFSFYMYMNFDRKQAVCRKKIKKIEAEFKEFEPRLKFMKFGHWTVKTF